MDGISRRRLLTAVGATGVGVGAAGCSDVLGRSSRIQIGGLLVDTSLQETHAIRVEVDRDGDRVFEETFELADDDEYIKRETPWSADPATYTVHTAVFGPEEDGDIVTWSDIDKPPADGDCFALTVWAGTTETIPSKVLAEPAVNWDLSCE